MVAACRYEPLSDHLLRRAGHRDVAAYCRRAGILFFSSVFSRGDAFLLLPCGVKGLLDFEDTIDQLPTAVEVVARGGFWVPRPILSRFVEETLKSARHRTIVPARGTLSARQREVRDSLLENVGR